MCSIAPGSGREIVTSVGNAWIICRSKSIARAGQIYYFNTLTGEAVWNLSETEAEKAKRRTQILQSQPGFLIENCPEPSEAPKDVTANKQPSSNMHQFRQCIVPPKVYNKQIINNCFPKSATMCTPHTHTHNVSHQFLLCNPTNPIPFNVAPAPNPATWNAAHQQLYVTPTCSQPNVEDVYLHDMSNMPTSVRYSGISQKQPGVGHAQQKFHINLQRPNKDRFTTKINKKEDLRYYLLKKREDQIKRKEFQVRATEAISNNNKYKRGAINPLSISIRRKLYSLGSNEEEDGQSHDDYEHLNNNYGVQKQGGNAPYPSHMRRRYSFSANEGENDEDNEWLEHSNNKHTNQGDVSPHPSRIKRRSYSFSANEEENDEDNEWLEHSNNKHTDTNQGDVSPHPSRIKRRSYSFSANEEENDEDNEWLEHSNTKYSDTKEGNISPRPSFIRRKSFSANQAAENDTNEGLEYTNNKYRDTNKSYVNALPSLSRSPKPNAEGFFNDDDDNMCLEENLNSQGDINPLERKFTKVLQVKESSGVTYIVPDSNVFLNNIDLLTDILNTDKQCHLLVPRLVMNKIQTATKTRYATLAYKALYFIHEQSDANLAIIESENEETESNDDNILNFCCQLTDQESLVLLTDDTEIINNANTNNINIHIITTAKLKQLVNEDKSNETTTRNIDSELANVKITIDNKSNIQCDEKISKSPVRKCLNPGKGLDENKVENQMCAKDVFQNDKKACDIGIQASFEFNSVSAPSVRDELLPSDSNKTSDSVLCKTDGISLKHNVPHDLSLNTKITKNKKIHKNKAKSTVSSDRSKVDNRVGLICPVSIINETTLSDGKNLTWSLFSNTSMESLNKINGGSDTSSSICRHSNRRENVTIEETSNSVISNTTSNVDTESERVGVHKANTEADDWIVMFEVTDGQMEEALRVKADEWVSRFVQIMEEALSQLLQREPGRAPGCIPPPWTLREAVQCVRQRFCHEPHVVRAADRLLAFSRDYGDLRGNIKSNLTPHKYMELYSYGVYIIDALQGVLSSNEDLLMAAEALSKLLDDIQQSHLDPGNQDSLNDISAQECEDNVASDKCASDAEVNQGDKMTAILTESPRRDKKNQSPASTPGKYNLRSQRKTKIEETLETSNNVTFIDPTIDPQSSFLTTLQLSKTSIAETVTEKPQPILGLETSDVAQYKSSSPSSQKMDELINSSGESTTPILNGDPKMNEPKIVRNFFKCVEFEDKLKNKTGHFNDNQDSWTYYNDDDDDEGGLVINEEFTGDYGDQEYYMDSNSYMNLDNNLWYNENIPEETNLNSSLQHSKAPNANCENETVAFKLYVENFKNNIMKAYSSIYDFIERSRESFQSEDTSVDDLRRMQARAEMTITDISTMCDQFRSILTRENTDQSAFEILKKKEFENVIVENDDKDSYRAFISKCLEDGTDLKETVELVLAACKLKAA
nr:uncharacterized protein LOC117986102 [Maniola hyperantus]